MARSKRAVRKAKGDARYGGNRSVEPPDAMSFFWQLQRLRSMSIEHVKIMVELAGRPEFVEHQVDVLEVALACLFKVGPPHPAQLRVVRRIVYGIGDTLLIARTGFGKSLTFQAFCALTSKVALQLIPLSKLGDQQAERMTRIKGASACLITAKTLEQDHGLLNDVRCCKYNHILLGPEQAVSPRFKSILRDPDFAKRVGLVIIDECHVLSTWGTFRASVTHIRELRHTLPSRVAMYGCTATLTEAQERDVCVNGGFRSEDGSLQGLQLIRISVDRPEIQLLVCPILGGRATSYAQLYFVLNGAIRDVANLDWFKRGHVLPPGFANAADCVVSPRIRRTPSWIPKTIIFIDGAKRIETAAGYIRVWLQGLGFTVQEAADIVCTYSSHTSRHDQDAIIAEFEKQESGIRIMVATSAVGMGMDIVDVDVVVQWDLPLDQEISDLWQRWGRVARAPGRSGLAVLFAPYYCFDRLGKAAPMNPLLANTSHGGSSAVGAQQSSRQSTRVPSRLRETQTVSSRADGGDSTIDSDYGSTADESDAASSQQAKGKKRRAARLVGPWGKQEIARRGRVVPAFLDLCNAACIRRVILQALRDHLSEPDSRQPAADGIQCCSGSACGPELARLAEIWAIAPDSKVSILRRPGGKTKSGRALVSLESWVQHRATEFSDRVGLMCAAPITIIMSLHARISIAVALGQSRIGRDGSGLPAPLCSVGAFQALDAVQLWVGELRAVMQWHTDVDVDAMVEQLRVDAAKWPVFDWKNPDVEDAPELAVRHDVALREADLAASRRDQKRKEIDLQVAIMELQERGGSAELTARLAVLTTDVQLSRSRAENIEFVLAAVRNVQQRVMLGKSQSALWAASRSTSDVAPSSFASIAGSAAPDASSSFTSVPVVSSKRSSTPAARQPSPSRPRTPVGNAPGKRAACTPGSGRRGRKRKVPRELAAPGDDRATGARDLGTVPVDDVAASSPSGSIREGARSRDGRTRTPSTRQKENWDGWR